MPVTYSYDLKRNALMTFPTGLLTVEEIADYFRRVSEDDTVPEGFVEVVHFDFALLRHEVQVDSRCSPHIVCPELNAVNQLLMLISPPGNGIKGQIFLRIPRV